MSENAPARMLDPICDMVVEVAEAKAAGRTVDYADRTYAFCSNGCVAAFNADPATWAAKADAAVAAERPGGEAVIDDGMRRWYASCRCCLSDAYPEIVAKLDAERDAAAAR